MQGITHGSMPAIVAHRGWHQDGAPENSVAALEAAAANGADSVENDIRALGDGTLVVHHDAELRGTPLSRLTRADVAGRADVPLLDAWSKRAGELGIHVTAEFKEHGHEQRAVDLLRSHLAPGKLDVMSFEPEVVRALRAAAPDLAVGHLSRARLPGSFATDAANLGASFVGLNVRAASPDALDAARALGLGTAIWTVDRPRDQARLIADARVDRVITDEPARALATRSSLGAGDAATGAIRLLRAAATMH